LLITPAKPACRYAPGLSVAESPDGGLLVLDEIRHAVEQR
jgi:hypothetical protein